MNRKSAGYDPLQQEEHPTSSSDVGRPRARLRYVGHRRPPPPKTTLAAVTMLVVGTVLTVMGIWHIIIKGDGSRGGHHLLIGGILLLPGSYASLNLLGAYLGWPGYDYNAIPSYDD